MNYYSILGVAPTSEPEVIEAAYRALMKKYHPDKWNGQNAEAELRAKLINEAYSALRDPRRRREYDSRAAAELLRARAGTRYKQQAGTKPWARSQYPAPPFRARQPSSAPAAAQSFSFIFGRSEIAGALVVFLGVLALAGVASRTPTHVRLAGIQTLLLPPARASLLDGGREQIFCLTNKTLQPIEYAVYWDNSGGQKRAIGPGSSVVHYSRSKGPPVIEFYEAGMSTANVARSRVTTRMSDSADHSCSPNFSFEYEDANMSQWYVSDRIRLNRDPVVDVPEAADREL